MNEAIFDRYRQREEHTRVIAGEAMELEMELDEEEENHDLSHICRRNLSDDDDRMNVISGFTCDHFLDIFQIVEHVLPVSISRGVEDAPAADGPFDHRRHYASSLREIRRKCRSRRCSRGQQMGQRLYFHNLHVESRLGKRHIYQLNLWSYPWMKDESAGSRLGSERPFEYQKAVLDGFRVVRVLAANLNERIGYAFLTCLVLLVVGMYIQHSVERGT